MYKQLLALGLFVGCVYCLTCRDDEFNLDEVRCCKRCDPGWGVTSDCTHDNDTVCAPCKVSSFSSRPSHTERCRQCTVCGSNAKQIAACNSQQDTICECDPGLYFNLTTRRCQACTICDIGFGVVRQCSKNQDTKCTPCVNGTSYSDEPSTVTRCIECSQCKDEQVTLRQCTTTEDSLCFSMDLSPGKPTKSDEDEEPSNTGAEFIPLYCAILGLVVAVLLAYVIYKQWKIRGKKRRMQYAEAEKGCAAAAAGKKNGSDSGVYVDEVRHGNNKRYADLPAAKRKDIESGIMSSQPESWQQVARHLGCPPERISALETQQETHNDSKHTPINSLLTDWSRQDGATVGALTKALRHSGRHDVIRIIQSDQRNSSPQPV